MKVSKVHDHLITLYRAGCRHTVLLLGPPGIGKSESSRNAADTLRRGGDGFDPIPNFGYRQWQATIEDPLELPGLPAVIGQKAVRVPFEDKIPTEGAGILCIDEINSASSLTQCSLYSLVWEGKLGGTVLSKDWMIVATGNHDKDRAVTQRIPTPLVSRMEHINVEADHESWLIKMAVDGEHDAVRAFMKSMPHLFSTFDPNKPGPFACPRTWTMVSKVMKAYGMGDKKDKQPPLESIAGWVGEGPAQEFLLYYTMAIDLPDPEYILAHPKTAPVPEDPGPRYAVTTSLASKSTFQNYDALLTYLDRMDIEFAVYCVSTSREVERGRMIRLTEEERSKYKKIRDNKAYQEWCLKHHQIITA